MSFVADYCTEQFNNLETLQSPEWWNDLETSTRDEIKLIRRHLSKIDVNSRLKHVTTILSELDEKLVKYGTVLKDDPTFKAGTLLLLHKCVIVLYAELYRSILDSTLHFYESIDYWKSIESSRVNMLFYYTQLIPSKLYEWGKERYKIISPDPVLYLQSMLWRVMGKTYTVQSYLFFSRIRREARSHLKDVNIIVTNLATRLGFLSTHFGEFPSAGSSDDEVYSSLIQKVQILTHVASIDPAARLPICFPEFDKKRENISIDTLRKVLSELIEQLRSCHERFEKAWEPHKRPGISKRYWLGGSALVGSIWLYRRMQLNVWEMAYKWSWETIYFARQYLVNWVINPVMDIYKTVRYNQSEFGSLISNQSLHADIDSLERMVVSFAVEKGIDQNELQTFQDSIRQGDISLVLRHYEKDMKHPFSNILFGDMVRLVLIQVQKVKVDLEKGMHAMDKLLKSNQLNFALIAVIPSLAIGAGVLYGLWALWRRRRGVRYYLTNKFARDVLRRIERKLNFNNCPQQIPIEEQGMILIEVHWLRQWGKRLGKDARDKFTEDVREIESTRLSIPQRLSTVQRMYRTHEFLK